MKNLRFFTCLVAMTFIALFFSSCEKYEHDSYHRMAMQTLTPDNPVGEFAVVELNNNPPIPGTKDFQITFKGEEIFSGKFYQDNLGPEYEIITEFVRKDDDTGLNIWYVYIVSQPAYHHVFLLVREDGEVVEEKITYCVEVWGRLVFPRLGVFFDGYYHILLRNNDHEDVSLIKVKFPQW